MKSTRRSSREVALQVLFQLEFAPQADLRLALDHFRSLDSAPEEVWIYALNILQGVQAHRQEIDELIRQHATHWRLERMPLVDLNILRVGTFELAFGGAEVPPAAVINEAVEIAKKYGSEDSGKFVNGVLDQIRKTR